MDYNVRFGYMYNDLPIIFLLCHNRLRIDFMNIGEKVLGRAFWLILPNVGRVHVSYLRDTLRRQRYVHK